MNSAKLWGCSNCILAQIEDVTKSLRSEQRTAASEAQQRSAETMRVLDRRSSELNDMKQRLAKLEQLSKEASAALSQSIAVEVSRMGGDGDSPRH